MIGIYVSLGFLFYTSSVSGQWTEPCISQLNSCSCKTQTGYINLAPLDEAIHTGYPRFSIYGEDGCTYYYNPCTPFAQGTCRDVALCQKWSEVSMYTEIGNQSTAKFISEADNSVVIEYQAAYNIILKDRFSYVKLVCDSNEGRLIFQGENISSQLHYNFTLYTTYACSWSTTPVPIHNVTNHTTPASTTEAPCHCKDDSDFMEIIYMIIVATFCLCALILVFLCTYILIHRCTRDAAIVPTDKYDDKDTSEERSDVKYH